MPPFRIQALTGILHEDGPDGPDVDGEVIGIGGIGFPADGVVLAFADLTEKARAHRFSLHRAAVKFLAEVRRAGISRLVATSDPQSEVAARWLTRLGFSLSHIDERTARAVWVWLAPTEGDR